MAALFYEPSSRTFGSFVAAMQRLGGGVIPLNMTNSSATKGESLEDTAKVFSSYADVIVMRNPAVGSAASMADHAWVLWWYALHTTDSQATEMADHATPSDATPHGA